MYLRSLELQGFKSFPDKTKLEFGKGITAVVGPNGSGKSNIGDAMRWVMGERSVKDLRGKRMEDVIFDGTLHRSKAAFAQVTITIDNSDRTLKTDSDIVAVTRKLYRKGDSEYIINGKQVRLQDVEELFMDTGLGSDGYAIIGQGKIGEIVSNKPVERRQIFDEAAGISKFRKKKRETELDLLRAEDNISRLTDILGELESRIEPLRKQCEKAKRFKVLDDEKSGLEVSLWVMRIGELIGVQRDYREKLTLLNEQYEGASAASEELEEKVRECRMKAAEQSDLAAAHRESIHEIELNDSQAEAKTAVLENDIKHLEERKLSIAESMEQSENAVKRLGEELEAKRRELEEIRTAAVKLVEDIAGAENELKGIQSELDGREGELKQLSDKINELYLKRSGEAFRLESAKNSAQSAEEQRAELSGERGSGEERRRLYEEDRRRASAERERLTGEKSAAENRIAGFAKLLEGKRGKLGEAQRSFSECDISLRETNQRINILRELERSMDGFSGSVKYIMKAAAQGRVRGICGSIAQLISTRPEYSTAIETALGAAMQNIAVENEEAAKRGIRLLKEGNAGRATFLPLTSVKGRTLERPPVGEEGFVALASELVSCDPKYSGLVSNLLGRVAVAEDIDCASAIAKRNGYRFKIVTLDGQVVNAGGSYTGGSVSRSAGLLTRRTEIAELEARAQSLTAKIGEHKQKCAALTQEVQNLEAETEGQREKVNELAGGIMRCEMDIKRIDELLEQLDESEEKLAENIRRLEAQAKEAEKQADEAAAELSELDKQIEESERERDSRSSDSADAAKKRAELSEGLSALKIAQAEKVKDEQTCGAEIGRIGDRIEETKNGGTRLAEESAGCDREIGEKREEIRRIADEVSGSAEKIAALEAQIAAAQQESTLFIREADKLAAEQKIKSEECMELTEQKTRLEERDKTLTAEFDKLVSRLWDEYGLTRTEAEENYSPPGDAKAAQARLAELKSQIKSLGHVNLGAIEEYAEVSERYEFMSGQLADVNKSKLELTELIESLTESMKSIFTENFERIAKRFSEIFKELFGGGKGSLSLSDPENVLECGIDIDVAPPGKVQKNLMSLSGGEMGFIAACILFAILSVRPSPFCLLDEIEAAFDDVNVAKYAAYLHKYTDRTQFITITHRRGTMEEADVLYGVTMQEDGISKLLKMDMNENN